MKALFSIVFVALVAISGAAWGEESYPWNGHAAPFTFLFGNHIDEHQQSLVADGGFLEGFFYIAFTGETLDGYPIAVHGTEAVGWMINGVPVTARLLARVPGHHPLWCVDAAAIPSWPGYTHFHWIGPPEHADRLKVGKYYEGYLMKLTARETFFFAAFGGYVILPGIDFASHANIVTDCR